MGRVEDFGQGESSARPRLRRKGRARRSPSPPRKQTARSSCRLTSSARWPGFHPTGPETRDPMRGGSPISSSVSRIAVRRSPASSPSARPPGKPAWPDHGSFGFSARLMKRASKPRDRERKTRATAAALVGGEITPIQWWREARNVVQHSVDALDFVDEPSRHPGPQIVGQARYAEAKAEGRLRCTGKSRLFRLRSLLLLKSDQ